RVKDDGGDPSVGLPRKDDSTSVIYRIAAYPLDTPTPRAALPAIGTLGLFCAAKEKGAQIRYYSITNEKSLERLPSSLTTQIVCTPDLSLAFFLVLTLVASNFASSATPSTSRTAPLSKLLPNPNTFLFLYSTPTTNGVGLGGSTCNEKDLSTLLFDESVT